MSFQVEINHGPISYIPDYTYLPNMEAPITKEFNVILRLIENYPEIEAMAKLLLISKAVNHLILSNVKHLIVPSHDEKGRRCLLKPQFLRKFPNLQVISPLDTLSGIAGDGEDDEMSGCRIALDDDKPPKIKGIYNIHVKVDGFIWYTKSKSSKWEMEKRHLRNIFILQVFVDLCKNPPEGTSYIEITANGIFCKRDAYRGRYSGPQEMVYSLPDKTFYNVKFGPYNLDENIRSFCDDHSCDPDCLNRDCGADAEDISEQVKDRYKAYFQLLREIPLKNINDWCFMFMLEIKEDSSIFKDLEGIVCVDFYNDDEASIVQDLVKRISLGNIDIMKKFLEPIKHYYLLSYDNGFVSYINDLTLKGCGSLATNLLAVNHGRSLCNILTFPDVDGRRVCMERILPNVKKDKD